jgi:hypothetical protein
MPPHFEPHLFDLPLTQRKFEKEVFVFIYQSSDPLRFHQADYARWRGSDLALVQEEFRP